MSLYIVYTYTYTHHYPQGMMQTIQKPHLRNLFYRVSTFYRLGANLVFVIDGDATQLKWITLDQRSGCEERRDGGRRKGHGERGERKSGRRPQLQRYVTEVRMLIFLTIFYMN